MTPARATPDPESRRRAHAALVTASFETCGALSPSRKYRCVYFADHDDGHGNGLGVGWIAADQIPPLAAGPLAVDIARGPATP